MTIKHKILIVDDLEEETDFLKSYLSRRGYSVFLADTGEEAIGKALEEKPQLMLLDTNLPGINGFEALRAIREFNKEVKVIMLSGYDLDRGKEALLEELDVFQFIEKPVSLQDIEEFIKRALGL